MTHQSLVVISLWFFLISLSLIVVYQIHRRHLRLLALDALKDKPATIALYDATTGLPNKILFDDRLSQILSSHSRQQQKFTMVMFGINQADFWSTQLSASQMEAVLSDLAKTMNQQIRATDSISRIKNDRFVVLLTNVSSYDNGELVADNLFKMLNDNFVHQFSEQNISFSMSLVHYPKDGAEAIALLSQAEQNLLHKQTQSGNEISRLQP